MKTVLALNHVSHVFRDGPSPTRVLADVSLALSAGEFVCLIGPSGSGKSTLLRIMAGLMAPTAGVVRTGEGLTRAMVFQHFALFPWLTVGENIAFGLTMAGAAPVEIHQTVNKQAAAMGLTALLDHHPKELSGGQRQRVGIARAMAVSPRLMLMDEPFSALDALTAQELRRDVLDLWRKGGMTVAMVTHLVEEGVELADRVIVFSPLPGRVERVVAVDLPRPRDVRSKSFYAVVDSLNATLTANK